jgi:hypothetical protein
MNDKREFALEIKNIHSGEAHSELLNQYKCTDRDIVRAQLSQKKPFCTGRQAIPKIVFNRPAQALQNISLSYPIKDCHPTLSICLWKQRICEFRLSPEYINRLSIQAIAMKTAQCRYLYA